MKRGITIPGKNELRFDACTSQTKHVSTTNISNKSKYMKVTNLQGQKSGRQTCSTGGAIKGAGG